MNRFIYTEGLYREFRGYVFVNMRPVTITDHATLEAVKKDKSFAPAPDEKAEVQAPARERPILTMPKRGWPLGKPRK